MLDKRSQGVAFEDLACSYLQAKGYKIIDRNIRIAGSEVDIVALDGETLVFIEVKGRRSTAFGSPSEAVGGRKRQRIMRAASAYMERTKTWNACSRFDVVSVMLLRDGKPTFEHLENAFGA